MTTLSNAKTVKTTFWGAAAFYFLIAFEFLYMASPFAVYFYSVYRPMLSFFNSSPILAGLTAYFLPHFTITSSGIVNLHNIAGGILAISGFLGFCIGACQVYYHKLARKGAVTGGIYNIIRHPQYASFIICSFGLLLLWPRYIVLVMFVTMLFAYYFLARVEEKECVAKFGQPYIDYMNRTGMFLPCDFHIKSRLPALPKSAFGKCTASMVVYLLVLSVSLSIAIGLHNLTLNSLYAIYENNSANISISELEPEKMKSILVIALSDKDVVSRIELSGVDASTKFLNYILPVEWYAAEIPMNGITGSRGHNMPSDYNRNLYKVIINKAEIRGNLKVKGKDILTNISKRYPLTEVWVDASSGKVIKIMDMPDKVMYENIPVALY